VGPQSSISNPDDAAEESPLEVDVQVARALLDQAPDGLIVADEDGRILLVNDGFTEMFRYQREQVIGLHVEELVPGDLRTRHRAHRLRFRAAPHRRPMGSGLELEGCRSDGSTFPVEISLSPLTSGESTLTIATIRDITDRRAAERDVRWVQRLLDSASDGVYVFRTDTLSFIHVNAGAADQSGYTRQQLADMGPLHLLPDFPERRFRALLAPLSEDDTRAKVEFQTSIRRADGSDVPVEVVCELLRPDPDFDPVYVATARDISERLSAQRTLSETRQRLALSEDRERIARDLHDKVIQKLFATGLGLQAAASRTEADSVRDRLRNAIDDLDQAIREIRTSIFALHAPASEHEPGLRTGVIEKATDASRVLGFSPTIQFSGPVDTTATEEVTEALLATLQETLSNIVRHAQASAVSIEVNAADGIELVVRDDGIGLEPAAVVAGEGLRNMRTRADDLGGELSIEPAGATGTKVTWRVPIK
jgi:PAS domain S-box-containing protein